MELRKITKTDKEGKRLFVEIGKRMKGGDNLPALKRGDEVLLLPVRKLTEKQLDSLIDKYIKFFDIDDDDSFALCFEGVVKLNKKEFWDENEEDSIQNKYVLIDPDLGPIDSFNNLDNVFDLQVISGKERYVNKVTCLKCKKQFFEAYKFCPHCGKKNKLFKNEE